METFVLTVSRYFPATHNKKGEPTYFPEKILNGIGCDWPESNDLVQLVDEIKIHTCRANYELWFNRIKQVQEGKAILSLRDWSGKPYNSKQIEFCQLGKDSGIGIQKLEQYNSPFIKWSIGLHDILSKDLAKNDGLHINDFEEWFRKYDLSKPMAIIHFTEFRY